MPRLAWLALLAVACVPSPNPAGPRSADVRDGGPFADVAPGAAAEDAAAEPSGRDAAGLPDAVVSSAPDSGPAEDAGAPLVDAGGAAGDSGVEPTEPLDLTCDGATLRDAAGAAVATYDSASVCGEVLDARGDGVVCAYFELGDPIGPEGWDEVGWRAMNWRTRIGLGRRPHETYESCLEATRSARGGVVCTNTGVGFKSAHIETNRWCGSSSSFSHCLLASAAARNFWVCSFPSDGDGSGPGWNLTHIDGATCVYGTGGLYLADCNAMIP